MSTEYTPVAWSKEPVSIEKLQQMVSNDQALFEMKPTTAIKHNGISRSKGMKILAGSQLFQPTKTFSTTSRIYFGNYFSAGCYPIVIAGLMSAPQTGLNVATKGIGGAKLVDHRGFEGYVWTDDRKGNKGTIQQPYYLTYIAVGF